MWSKILSNLIKTETMQALLQKPGHTVGVAAGIASVGVTYTYVTLANSSRIEQDKQQNLSIMRIDEENRLSYVRTDEFKRKIPWPFRLFF